MKNFSKGTLRKIEHQVDVMETALVFGVPLFILSQIGNVVVDWLISLW